MHTYHVPYMGPIAARLTDNLAATTDALLWYAQRDNKVHICLTE